MGSGGRRSVCLWLCRLLSVPSGEQASEGMWDCSGHRPRSPKVLRHQMVQWCAGGVPEMMWHRQWGHQFCCFFKLDKFKIIITLRRAQDNGDNDYIQISFSCITLSVVLFLKTVVSRPQKTFCYLLQSSGSDPRGERLITDIDAATARVARLAKLFFYVLLKID